MVSKVSGHRQTAQSLRALAKLFSRPISEAQRKSLRPVLNSWRKNLRSGGSVKRGVLIKSTTIRTPKSKPGTKRALVTASGKGRYVAHLVEFGTDPHWQPKLRRQHPGAKANPALTRAYEEHKTGVLEDFRKEIIPAIERQAARLNKGKRRGR